MKYVGVNRKGAKVQSKQRKLPSKSRSDSSIKSSKSDKKSRTSQQKSEKRDRLKEVRFSNFAPGLIRTFFDLYRSIHAKNVQFETLKLCSYYDVSL